MEYHVAKTGSDQGQGTRHEPFLTINKAASVAVAGDTVIVHEGVYREWIKPRYKGLSEKRRIIYQAAEGEKVVIKGSEHIQDWQPVEGNIWRVVLPNTLFGNFNPYAEEVYGDWLVTIEETMHLGDVYLNGMSFYEVSRFDQLVDPTSRTEVKDLWTHQIVPLPNPKQTTYVWFAEVNDDHTTIYANFQGADPNKELVEINVRRSCFYPVETGIDYITVRGFEMAHAATPWAPPTADQPGLLGTNWSKGWIIENNVIHDAKCSAVSIGKEASTGNNYRSIRKDKPGYQYQLESVFTANLFVEVSHGPYIVDHNILTSEYALDNVAQGGAYINNLIGGKMIHRKVLNRSTQYHLPHSTKIAGFSLTYGGDDRFYNNIIIGKDGLTGVGTSHFNKYTTSIAEYIENVHKLHGDLEEFEIVEQPVYINNNAYFNGAEPFERENVKLVERSFDPNFSIIDQGEEGFLSIELPESVENIFGEVHSTATLSRVRIVDAEFENPDGSNVILDTDFLDVQRGEKSTLGPITLLKKGKNYIKVW